jgi:hypothetical protein
MSGSTDDLLADCTSAFTGALRILVSEVLFLLLDSQYIVLKSDSTSAFKVVEGSGMGLMFSGAVASLSFYRRVEVHMINPSGLTEHRVTSYSRYHDDIICVYHCAQSFVRFVHQMRTRAGYFKIKCTKVSSDRIPYLDLNISKSNCILHVEPLLEKPIIPLAPQSGHAPWVHAAWPTAVASRYLRLACGHVSTNPLTQNFDISAIKAYYERNNVSPLTLRVLNNRKPVRKPSLNPSEDMTGSRPVWLKAVSHPVWNKTMPSWVSHMQPHASVKANVRIAWCNSNKSLAHEIRAHNTRKLGGR